VYTFILPKMHSNIRYSRVSILSTTPVDRHSRL
jgi:hypothetical protein